MFLVVNRVVVPWSTAFSKSLRVRFLYGAFSCLRDTLCDDGALSHYVLPKGPFRTKIAMHSKLLCHSDFTMTGILDWPCPF